MKNEKRYRSTISERIPKEHAIAKEYGSCYSYRSIISKRQLINRFETDKTQDGCFRDEVLKINRQVETRGRGRGRGKGRGRLDSATEILKGKDSYG